MASIDCVYGVVCWVPSLGDLAADPGGDDHKGRRAEDVARRTCQGKKDAFKVLGCVPLRGLLHGAERQGNLPPSMRLDGRLR
jgi:hypothetical protein